METGSVRTSHKCPTTDRMKFSTTGGNAALENLNKRTTSGTTTEMTLIVIGMGTRPVSTHGGVTMIAQSEMEGMVVMTDNRNIKGGLVTTITLIVGITTGMTAPLRREF